jgi:Protein of unknown function (DUF2630)
MVCETLAEAGYDQGTPKEIKMDDKEIIAQIGDLAAEERRLEEAHAGEGISEDERNRLQAIEVTLDRLWDLLRQRRALRDSGRSPDEAQERPGQTVEGYLQ